MLDLPRPSLIGVIHLPPLPGAPRFAGSMRAVRDRTLRDAEALAAAGFDAVIVENFGDAPFYRGPVPPETVAAITLAADDAMRASGLPLGVNVLRNDGASALAVAAAVGARFVRVNVLSGARVTDQGVIESDAARLLRLRASLGANDVGIAADVDVKHSAPLGAPRADAIEEEAAELHERALASALIVTGARTGGAADAEVCARVRAAVPDAPLWIGSGVTTDSLARWLSVVDGVIVGSALRADGRAGGPIDPARALAFTAAAGR